MYRSSGFLRTLALPPLLLYCTLSRLHSLNYHPLIPFEREPPHSVRNSWADRLMPFAVSPPCRLNLSRDSGAEQRWLLTRLKCCCLVSEAVERRIMKNGTKMNERVKSCYMWEFVFEIFYPDDPFSLAFWESLGQFPYIHTITTFNASNQNTNFHYIFHKSK